MDAHEIAEEIATHLQGRDDIADTEMSENELETIVLVRTQGGKLYHVIVEPAAAATDGDDG